jgi:tight adherence protein B
MTSVTPAARLLEGLPVDMSMWAGGTLAAVAAAGIAYVFIYPLLSGEARAEKRQKALVHTQPDRRLERVVSGVNRREQIAQSLKELEARESARSKLTLEQRIAQAGLRWNRSRFFAVSAMLGLVSGLILFSFTLDILAGAAGAFAGAFGLPRWILIYLKNKRINRFLEELPNAMDVIVRGVRAGLPLGDCFRIIASEAQEPVRSEFRAIMETMALGVPLSESVTKLYERVPVTEANFFAIVIAVQQKAGGNLAEAIGNLSKVVRERKKMKSKIAAMSMEAKASAGIIAALPFVVALLTYLSSPRYIELLWTTQAGKVALAASSLWMMTGVLVMKKMITFRV